MTKKDEESFQKADKCQICDKQYVPADIRVRDHCHLTGKYRGSAHQDCNLNLQLSDKLPVIFHFIMQELGKLNHQKANVCEQKRGRIPDEDNCYPKQL